MIKQKVYFLGIGGIGMSALAQYFVQQGHDVFGYDGIASEITEKLSQIGVTVHHRDSIESIPAACTDKSKTTVVYTPAMPEDSPLFGFFKSTGFNIFKRSEVLGELSREIHCLAVGGTHGKTTTSTILAHLLRESGKKITAFLGGISSNFGSNFISNGTEHMVVEADEFDRSFLELHPDLLCITSMDADHLDIYQNEKNLEKSFKAFASLVSNPHHRWIKDGLELSGLSFGTASKADVRVQNIKIENGNYVFDFHSTDQMLRNLQFGLPGAHNLMNATVAIAMALSVGCDPNSIAKALQTFKGVERRFSIRMEEPFVLIDDYAHHPTEIDQMAQSIQEFYPSSQKTIAVFQPHLFSRTRDFCDGFAESLSQFDHTLLLDIYPARELPIPGVTSQSIQDSMRGSAEIVSKNQLLEKVVDACADVVVFMGAGDIADEVQPIVEHLKRKLYVG
ncbi:MAG: UDP-N-acetylmuramate--L-alanine ligase [Bacteroidota bacterium]|nr:UDP-N-acetylmuramate--L-alanine ligase [Bacteroidota bacterium]